MCSTGAMSARAVENLLHLLTRLPKGREEAVAFWGNEVLTGDEKTGNGYRGLAKRAASGAGRCRRDKRQCKLW